MADNNKELTLENEFIRNGLLRFNVENKDAYDIVNSNRDTVPMEIMKKYCIGPIYFSKKGTAVRISSMFVSGLGASYMTRDLSNKFSIPCNGIKDIIVNKDSDNYKLVIKRCVVGANKKCIDVTDIIILSETFEILKIDSDVSIGKCPDKIKPNDSLYRKVARYFGLEEYTNEEEFKKIKTKLKEFKDIAWILDVDWDLVLENLGDSVNFNIDGAKEYCYILNDVNTEEEMNHVTMVISERLNKSFSIEKISKPFNVKMLELIEDDDEKSAIIKLKVNNDILVDRFKKVNLLNTIANIMEVENGK